MPKKRTVKKPCAVFLHEAIILADIARLLGNQEWRGVFITLAEKLAPGRERSLLIDLSLTCNEAVLDANYSIMR